MADISAIKRVVRRAGGRLRLQSALEAAAVAAVPASVAVIAVLLLIKTRVVEWGKEPAIVVFAGALVLVGATIGYLRRFSSTAVATRVDRASGLSDRLASACQFEAVLAGDRDLPAETRDMMQAAIDDAIRVAPEARVAAATPFRAPRFLPHAAGAMFFAVAAWLIIDPPPVAPQIELVTPVAAPRGGQVTLRGERFCGPHRSDVLADGLCAAEKGEPGTVFFGQGPNAAVAPVTFYGTDRIDILVPESAPIGHTAVSVNVAGRPSRPIEFEVIAADDPRATPPDLVVLEEDDLEYTRDLVAELRRTAEATEDLELQKFADEVDELLDKTEEGELTKKQLLEAMAKAEEEYMKGSQEAVEEAMSDLEKTGVELKKDKVTRELGKALEKGDLKVAQKEIEKLADKLEKNELSEKDQEKLAQAMEKAAEKMQKAADKREKAQQKRVDKQTKKIRQLERKLAQTKNEAQKQQLERRLEKERRELKRLQRDKQKRDRTKSKRALKQLRRDMKKAARQLRNKTPRSRREVSKTMRDMSRRAGKVDADKRKMANRRKVASQMSDLKEAMRRAKRKGSRGPKNRFGRNRRNRDFGRRARGGKGQKGAWKPGQSGKGGQGKQGQNGKGGQGQQPGGQKYGQGHDPDLLGDPTKKSGNTEDESMQGVHGEGPSVRETILTSAQKGFATRAYKDVYTRYKTIVEEVIKAENVPSGYKYYVKKYFQKIKPHAM